LAPVHVPQLIMPPQVSPCMPQVKPRSEQVFAVHVPLPQTFGPPPPQFSPASAWHEPQSMVPPHPSVAMPQLNFWSAQVFGVHVKHVPPVAPEHAWPVGHVPQLIVLPQPSMAMPQLKPCCMQLMKVGHVLPLELAPVNVPVEVTMELLAEPPVFEPVLVDEPPPTLDMVEWEAELPPDPLLEPQEATATTIAATYASRAKK
jgi:hypothetical protein